MKKFIYIILVSVLVVAGIQNVKADEYTDMLGGIAEQFNAQNATVSYKYCLNQGGKITAKYNDVGIKSIIITCSGFESPLIALNYREDEHSLIFAKNGGEGNINSDSDSLFIIIDNILEAFLIKNGYSDMALPSDFGENDDFKLSFNPLQVEAQKPFIRQGKVLEEKGDISYLKISLEKSKIETFVQEKGDKYIRKLMEVTPTLASNSVTSSTVSLSPTVSGTYESSYQASCYLYRSSKKDSDYSIVATVDNCLTGSTIKDSGLSANTTYYYKIQLVGSRKISEPIAMTTSSALVNPDPEPDQNVTPDNTNNNTTQDNGKENPNTGAFVPSVILSLFAIGSVGTLIYTNNKNKFKNY